MLWCWNAGNNLDCIGDLNSNLVRVCRKLAPESEPSGPEECLQVRTKSALRHQSHVASRPADIVTRKIRVDYLA